MRIGILGGTFNPIHLGHLILAEQAHDRLSLDKVIFIPTYLPPHKSGKGVLSAEHRLNMVKLATKGNPHFEVSDVEIQREGKSYSIDTLKHIKEKYPESKIYFLIGQDIVSDLKTWKDIDEVLKLAVFVVFNRKGYPQVESEVPCRSLEMPVIDVSSTFLRKNIRSGHSVKYLLPDAVEKYLEKEKLFKD